MQLGTSLKVQWLRIHLLMQGTQVQWSGKIPHATGHQSLCTTSAEPTLSSPHAAAKSASVVSDSVRPHRRKPTRLPRPWDSPGKNAGVGRHFLLQCMKGKSESEVTQLCLTRCDPMDCSLPGSTIHGIFQARVLEWVGISCSK